MIWIGSKLQVKNAKKRFWENLYAFAKDNYKIHTISAINKITTFYSHVIDQNILRLEQKKTTLFGEYH